MENGPPYSYKEGLPTTISSTKFDKRQRPKSSSSSSYGTPTIFLAFFSCVAWLYVAGRLWQDAENRMLLSNLLQKHTAQRPKVLTVEDKLTVLGCKDLERRIVEAEMEITLAKSQGFLKNQLKKAGTSSNKGLLAVIGLYTGFGSRLTRNVLRGSWTRNGNSLKMLEERGVIIRFVIGRSPNRGDTLDRNIEEENLTTNDFLILDGHEEADEELAKKAKFFFSTAVQNWDAEFYVKVDNNINLDLDGLIELLEKRRGQDSAYIGCMKSGEVVAEEGKQWYEPEWWKFGDEKTVIDNDYEVPLLDEQLSNLLALKWDYIGNLEWRLKSPSWQGYFRHAAGSLFILSKNFAQYININSASLKAYAHEDISVGSWMMGIQATYIDDSRLCCGDSGQDKVCYTI